MTHYVFKLFPSPSCHHSSIAKQCWEVVTCKEDTAGREKECLTFPCPLCLCPRHVAFNFSSKPTFVMENRSGSQWSTYLGRGMFWTTILLNTTPFLKTDQYFFAVEKYCLEFGNSQLTPSLDLPAFKPPWKMHTKIVTLPMQVQDNPFPVLKGESSDIDKCVCTFSWQ